MDRPQNMKITKKKYGKNYERALTTFVSATLSAMRDFVTKYPHADRSRFSLKTLLNSDGTLNRVDTNFIHGKELINIKSDTFKNNKEWTKYLTMSEPDKTIHDTGWPKIFLGGGKIPPFEAGKIRTDVKRPSDIHAHRYEKIHFPVNRTLNYPIHNFKIHVSDIPIECFMSGLPRLQIEDETIWDVKWDDNLDYYQTIFAVYCASYGCGVSMEHLTPSDDVHPIVTSIMRFHLYFTTCRLLTRMQLGETTMSDLSEEFNTGDIYNRIDVSNIFNN